MKDIDRYGNDKIAVKQCSSATCEGSEIGCSNGDCLFSTHHAKSARWKYWTIKHFEKMFGRKPRERKNPLK